MVGTPKAHYGFTKCMTDAGYHLEGNQSSPFSHGASRGQDFEVRQSDAVRAALAVLAYVVKARCHDGEDTQGRSSPAKSPVAPPPDRRPDVPLPPRSRLPVG